MKTRFIAVLAALLLLPLFAGSQQQSGGPTIMQQVFMAKRLIPGMKTVGVFCDAVSAADDLKQLQVACTAYELALKTYRVKDLFELRESFDSMVAGEKADVIWILRDDVTDQKFGRRFLSERCIAQKIPLFVHSAELVREGALFSVGPDQAGQLKIFYNKKVGSLIQANIPAEAQSYIVAIE